MKITENTTVTVGLVIVIIGGAIWLSRIHFIAESAATMARETKTVQELSIENLAEVKTDVKWIKRKLGGPSD